MTEVKDESNVRTNQQVLKGLINSNTNVILIMSIGLFDFDLTVTLFTLTVVPLKKGIIYLFIYF